MSEARKKLAIIDGKSVFYRGYYALPNLSTKEGVPTGGVYGFAAMALELIKRLKPDYVAVAWDKPKTNIRKRLELYPQYKAGRKPAPPDFYTQIPILLELLEAFGWPMYELDDYEADDIMGALAVQAAKKDIETMLITSDLDVLQLVNAHVKVYALKKGLTNIEEFHPESFAAKYGIKPEQFLDLKALKGDSSDNVPGVPGVGEKTALELLKKYKTLDEVYKKLDEIPDKLRAKLETGKESAYLSKKLLEIWTNAPIKLDLGAMDTGKIDPGALRSLLQRLEFRSLLNNLPDHMQVVTPDTGISGGLKLDLPKHVLITADKDLAKINLKKADIIFIHSRAAGRHGADPQVLIIGTKDIAYTLDLTKLKPAAVKKALSSQLSAERSLVGYDIKSDIKLLKNIGIDCFEANATNLDAAQGSDEQQSEAYMKYGEGAAESITQRRAKSSSRVVGSAHKQAGGVCRVGHDVLVAAYLLNPLLRAQSLSELALANLRYDGASLENLPTEDFIARAPEFLAVIRELHEGQYHALGEAPKLAKLAQEIEWPLTPVLAQMEYTGIKLDTSYLKKFAVELNDTISDLEQTIYGHANFEFNISSPAQLADVLFGKLNLPKQGIKKGKTGFSTAASELDKLRSLHPIIDLITQYREVVKLKNTYVDTLPGQVDENSRLHTTFHLTIAPTGRLSSADPNLQNIPVRTDLGKRIRTAFVAEKGNVLVSADYSQFELRIAAALSGDKGMIEAFNRDADIHEETSAAIYSIPIDKVTKDQRYSAKAVNFGIMYGLGPHALSVSSGMDYAEAKKFIDRYFEIRPKLKEYIDKLRTQAKEKGYVQTLMGRRRPTPDVNSSNFQVREAAYRAAVNMPLQGTAADLMKMAMIKVSEELGRDCQMLLQIHDSILIECPSGKAKEVGKIAKETMENIFPKLPVKLKVDISTGKNWGQL